MENVKDEIFQVGQLGHRILLFNLTLVSLLSVSTTAFSKTCCVCVYGQIDSKYMKEMCATWATKNKNSCDQTFEPRTDREIMSDTDPAAQAANCDTLRIKHWGHGDMNTPDVFKKIVKSKTTQTSGAKKVKLDSAACNAFNYLDEAREALKELGESKFEIIEISGNQLAGAGREGQGEDMRYSTKYKFKVCPKAKGGESEKIKEQARVCGAAYSQCANFNYGLHEFSCFDSSQPTKPGEAARKGEWGPANAKQTCCFPDSILRVQEILLGDAVIPASIGIRSKVNGKCNDPDLIKAGEQIATAAERTAANKGSRNSKDSGASATPATDTDKRSPVTTAAKGNESGKPAGGNAK